MNHIITWRKRSAAGFLAAGCLALFAGSLKADDMAYMLAETAQGPTNPFGTLDLNTGAFTLIGSMGLGGYAGLGVANGTLFTEQNGGLYSVNTTNASLTLIGGPIGNNIPTFGSTTTGLYGLAPEGGAPSLVSINPLTGAVTAIGALGVIPPGGGSGAVLSTNSGTLYMEYQSTLYTINTTTGAGTLVGADSNFQALLFEDGTLYGGYPLGIHGAEIDTISPTTGQVTTGAALSGSASIFFGAFAPDPLSASSVPPPPAAPEPASLVLLGAGLGAIGVFRRYCR